MNPPVRYSPDLETTRPDERETVAEIEETLGRIQRTTALNSGRAIRAVHAKGHGYLRATLTVPAGLPAELAQGLFARPGDHPALLRFSTNPGDILDDSVSLPRGLALKVLEVEGERLPGSGDERTQDFLMVDGPVFGSPDPRKFLRGLRVVATTTDRAEWAKKALSAVARQAERAVEAVGGESLGLKGIGGARNLHPLGETYFTQTPYRHGDFVAKYSLRPASVSLTRHEGAEIDAAGRPDAIRAAMDRDTRQDEMEWELRAQLLRDPDRQPVEDPTVAWDEADSPWQVVARLRAAPQSAFDPAGAARFDDRLRFSVWTGLAAHRPLGAVNRARRDAYQFSAGFRERFNGCPIHEAAAGDFVQDRPAGPR